METGLYIHKDRFYITRPVESRNDSSATNGRTSMNFLKN